ncbi:MAG: MGMT family protein [Treponema sp.]|nr:MGMT family protein [Treponema sp.]
MQKSIQLHLFRINILVVIKTELTYTTYGQIAEHLGNKKMSRAVGNILHANPLPDYYPCYKVVNAKGLLAKNFGLGIEEQKRRLEKDGIKVEDYRVDLEICQWSTGE